MDCNSIKFYLQNPQHLKNQHKRHHVRVHNQYTTTMCQTTCTVARQGAIVEERHRIASYCRPNKDRYRATMTLLVQVACSPAVHILGIPYLEHSDPIYLFI